MQDPRNMHLDDIRKVLQHCYRLQAESGPESSFRFALFCGPKRKRLFANYPDNPNTELVESEHGRRKKNKGKQREDPLQGLLRMDESEPPNGDHIPTVDQQITNARVAGSSNSHRTDPQTSSNGFVRIDMGQMLQLKDMGYDVLGPVNGPNEGYPEYDVPKAVYELLVSHRRSEGSSRQMIAIDPALLGQIGADPGPTEIVGQQINAIINPPLNSQSSSYTNLATLPPNNTANNTNVNERPPTLNQQNVAEIGGADPGPIAIGSSHEPGHISNTDIRPTTPPITVAVGANTFKTPKKRLGKRVQKNLSPQTLPQNQNTNKKKKVTDDDLAALEAQNMVQAGSRRRSKPTWRK